LNSRKALCADIFEAQFFERDAASQSGSIVEGSHEGMLELILLPNQGEGEIGARVGFGKG